MYALTNTFLQMFLLQALFLLEPTLSFRSQTVRLHCYSSYFRISNGRSFHFHFHCNYSAKKNRLPLHSITSRGGEEHNPKLSKDDGLLLLPDDALLDKILQVALEASAKAASIIAKHSDGSAVIETKSTSRDLLTMIDPQCEEAIRETITKAFPDHNILGEEGVEPGIEAAKAALEEALVAPGGGFLWIVDPIDGTTNFASGIPFNAPSVAVAYQGEIIVGVIHDPHRHEIWTAVKGRGAVLNGEPLKIDASSPTSIQDAVIGAESPAGQKSLEVAVKGIQALMPKCRTIRILGSTAVKMPWVAKGRLTCYWSPDECAWDHAAGAIIVQEAGGVITDLDGSPFTLRTRKFLVSQNEQVHKEVLQVLKNDAGVY